MTATNEVRIPVIEHEIGAHGALTIRLANAELRLAATDGERVVVRTPTGAGLPDRVLVETADGELTIREKESHGLTFTLGRKVVQLEIDVPATAEITVDTASGWVDAIGLRGDQRYRTASADTRLRDGAGRIELNTVSGDATIELADTTDLAIKSVSGDVSVRGGRLSALRVGTTSGDVGVDSPLIGRTGNTVETLSGDVSVVATSGMRVDARTVSGDLTSDLPHRSEGRPGRRSLIVGDGSIEMTFRSVSGDLRVHDGSRRAGSGSPAAPPRPASPAWPAAPSRPAAPAAPIPPAALATSGSAEPGAAPDDREPERMAILHALERGELDVPTAMDRLAALDAAGTGPSDEETTDA